MDIDTVSFIFGYSFWTRTSLVMLCSAITMLLKWSMPGCCFFYWRALRHCEFTIIYRAASPTGLEIKEKKNKVCVKAFLLNCLIFTLYARSHDPFTNHLVSIRGLIENQHVFYQLL